MHLMNNYQKFKEYLSYGGFYYALWRGIKYFVFIGRKIRPPQPIFRNKTRLIPDTPANVIKKGRVKFMSSDFGVKIYNGDFELTHGIGLNSAINIGGEWVDSSKGEWKILENRGDYFRLQVNFKKSPITQIWHLKIKNEHEIFWRIEMNMEEILNINERRVVCLASRQYKSWINGHSQGTLPDAYMWRDILLDDSSSRFVGLRFSKDNKSYMPALGLIFYDSLYTETSPLIQNTPREVNAYIVGTRMLDKDRKKSYLWAQHNFFSGKIILSDDDCYLEKQMRYRGVIKKSLFLIPEKGICYALEGLLGFFFVRKKDYSKSKISSKLSGEPVSFLKSRLRALFILFNRKMKKDGLFYILKQKFNRYLDIVNKGIFLKRVALRGPEFVQIDLTNKCNNNCIACWCNSPLMDKKRNDGKSLSYEKTVGLINKLKKMGTREIYLAGGGEPFMYPQILDVVRYIKENNLVCYLNTNFTLVDEEIISELVRLKLDYLIISLWSGTPFVYKITHPNRDGLTFYRMEQLLKFLAQIKEKNHPFVCINNVISNLNWRDIKNMICFALDVKADAVNFAVLDVIPGVTDRLLLDKNSRQMVIRNLQRIMNKRGVTERLKFWGIKKFVKRLSNPYSENGSYDKGLIDKIPCYTGWQFARILANGDVNACLKAHRIPIGNINNEPFAKIWNSKNQQEFRRKTCAPGKDDPFFINIGNDPDTDEAGCYRSCDDFERNLKIAQNIDSLTFLEEKLCDWTTRLLSLAK